MSETEKKADEKARAFYAAHEAKIDRKAQARAQAEIKAACARRAAEYEKEVRS